MFEAVGAKLSFCRHFWDVDEAIDYCVMREGGLTKNLFNLKKTHWMLMEATGDSELIRSKNGNHAIARNGNDYLSWDFDVLDGETREQNSLKSRDRDAEYAVWLGEAKLFMNKEQVNADQNGGRTGLADGNVSDVVQNG